MGSRVQLYLSYPQEMDLSKVKNACVFSCKIIFLDHKYTVRLCVCLNSKNRVYSPNLILKICVFSVQTCFTSHLEQAPMLWGENTRLARALCMGRARFIVKWTFRVDQTESWDRGYTYSVSFSLCKEEYFGTKHWKCSFMVQCSF